MTDHADDKTQKETLDRVRLLRPMDRNRQPNKRVYRWFRGR